MTDKEKTISTIPDEQINGCESTIKAYNLGVDCFLESKTPRSQCPYPYSYEYHVSAFYKGYNDAKILFEQ